MIAPYAPPEGWYLVVAERRRMEREAARRLSVRFQIDTSAAQAALAEMTRKLVRASEQLRPVLKALGEAQQRQEAAALKMGKGVVDAHRRAGLLPPER